jgi:AraC family transcriptional regulator
VRDYLHAHFQRPLELAEVAAAGPVHPTHLAAAFRHRYGVTVGAYLRRLRVDAARRAILAGDGSLSRIAVEHGFADQAHLSRLFRFHLGITPGSLRAQARRTA